MRPLRPGFIPRSLGAPFAVRLVEAAVAGAVVPEGGIVGEAELREAAAGSYQDIIRRVEGAVRGVMAQAGQKSSAYIRALFPTHAVVSLYSEAGGDRLMSFPYQLEGDVGVKLGAPTQVVEAFRSVADGKLVEAAGALIEALAAEDGRPSEGKRFSVRVVQGGLSKNGNYYPDRVLEAAAPLFNGARVFVKSDAEHLAAKGKDVRNLFGRLTEAAFHKGPSPDTGEIRAVMTLISPSEPMAVKVREAVQADMQDVFGLSIDADGRVREGKAGGRTIRVTEAIKKVHSVDLIVEPGAGGQVLQLLEAADPNQVRHEDAMLRQTIIDTIRARRPQLLAGRDPAALSDQDLVRMTEALGADPAAPAGTGEDVASAAAKAAEDAVTRALRLVEARAEARRIIDRTKLPEAARNRLAKEFEARTEPFDARVVEARVKEEIEYLAPLAGGGHVVDLGDGSLRAGEGRPEKVRRMLEAFFDPAHADHRHAKSFKDLYVDITGDAKVTGIARNCDAARLRESLASDTLDGVLGDSINRRMLADYSNRTVLDVWRPIANIGRVNDFRDQTRTRWGGYGDLPQVGEKDPYLGLSTPDDEPDARYRVKKRGGTEEITIEMIKNDDADVVRRVPIKLARAAKRTLSRGVMMMIADNPVVYDGKAWFHADHANLGSSALSDAGIAEARLALKEQREPGSDEKLSIPAKYLLVPDALEQKGMDLFRRDTNIDETFVQSLKLTVLPVWCWEDPTDWAVAADPMDLPYLEVGFLDGEEEPQLFIQDDPKGGSLFANDTWTYKIRHVWGVCATDFRGIRKHVVPG